MGRISMAVSILRCAVGMGWLYSAQPTVAAGCMVPAHTCSPRQAQRHLRQAVLEGGIELA
jgi:hypothetical protein